MRVDVPLCCGKERSGGTLVDAGCKLWDAGRAVCKLGEDRSFALQAVVDQRLQSRSRVFNRSTVAGQEPLPGARGEAMKRCHVIGHVAIRRGNDAGGPTHYMIPRKQRLAQGNAQMPAKMAGGVVDLKVPLRAGDPVSVAKLLVGSEWKVQTLPPLSKQRGEGLHPGTSAGKRVAEGQDRCRDMGGEPVRQRGMVAVGVGDNDLADAPAGPDTGEDGLKMRVKVRAGIDDGDVAAADQVGVGAIPGEGRRIGGGQATDQAVGYHQTPRMITAPRDALFIAGRAG